MKKRTLLLTTILIGLGALLVWGLTSSKIDDVMPESELVEPHQALYKTLALEGKVSYTAFDSAMIGYENLQDKRSKDILVLVDFSKPSTEERLYVLDIAQNKVLYRTHVAHGRGSGDNYATSFSNRPGSNQSSLGFYLTANTYQGSNGYSLRLNGLEEGINDKAMERAIVIHGANYCDPQFISSAGRLGRSLGCPSLPTAINKEVINTIKNGAVMFVYADNGEYLAHSPILSRRIDGLTI